MKILGYTIIETNALNDLRLLIKKQSEKIKELEHKMEHAPVEEKRVVVVHKSKKTDKRCDTECKPVKPEVKVSIKPPKASTTKPRKK